MAIFEQWSTFDCARSRHCVTARAEAAAVALEFTSKGVGSALMRHAIEEARRLEHGGVRLVGDAAYYSRFGFSAERTGELSMPGPF